MEPSRKEAGGWEAVATHAVAGTALAGAQNRGCCHCQEPAAPSHVAQQRQALCRQHARVGIGGARPHQEPLGDVNDTCKEQ